MFFNLMFMILIEIPKGCKNFNENDQKWSELQGTNFLPLLLLSLAKFSFP